MNHLDHLRFYCPSCQTYAPFEAHPLPLGAHCECCDCGCPLFVPWSLLEASLEPTHDHRGLPLAFAHCIDRSRRLHRSHYKGRPPARRDYGPPLPESICNVVVDPLGRLEPEDDQTVFS